MSIPRDEWVNRWVDHMATMSSDRDEEFLIGLPDSDDHFWDQQMEAFPNDPEACAENMIGDHRDN